MFTGIIEEVGTVLSFDSSSYGARLVIGGSAVLGDVSVGASIAVNGTCLTAVGIRDSFEPRAFEADLSPETLARTNLGALEPGMPVNLERPLRFNGRLDGHFVLGHVDGIARVVAWQEVGDGNWLLRIALPSALSRYAVPKASLALDGISLTVAAVEGDELDFAIIPHTYRSTNLHSLRVGASVNVEADILAKHIEKLLKS